MPESRRYQAVVFSAGKRVYVPVPFDPDEVWGSKPRHHVAGTVNGMGVRAKVNGRDVLVGSRAFLGQSGIDVDQWAQQSDAWRAEAKTVVFFAVDGKAAGMAAVADPIKETTREAIEMLADEFLQ